jgi:preprotein translocase subunit SecE
MKVLIEKIRTFVKDVRSEMAKVSWPTREELKDSTMVVIVVTLAFAFFAFSVDRLLSSAIKLLFSYLVG